MAIVELTVTHTINANHSPTTPKVVGHSVHVTETIAVSKSTVFNIVITQSMILTHNHDESQVVDPKNETVSHVVTVAESRAIDKVKAVPTQEMTVGDSITFNLSLVRSLSSNIELSDSVAIWKSSYQYIDPGIQDYVAGLTAPSEVTFTCSPNSITVRKPEFGDTDEYGVFRVQRENRGGDLQVFQDPDWPTTEILEMEFAYLDAATAADFLIFLTQSLGKLVTFVDYVGRTWEGVILTPTGDVVQKGRFNYTVKLRFQGTLQ